MDGITEERLARGFRTRVKFAGRIDPARDGHAVYIPPVVRPSSIRCLSPRVSRPLPSCLFVSRCVDAAGA